MRWKSYVELGHGCDQPAGEPLTGLRGGVDILDGHTGRRLGVMLPEPFAMLETGTGSFHGKFMMIDQNGERPFASTAYGLSVMSLRKCR